MQPEKKKAKRSGQKKRQRIGDYRIFIGTFPTGEQADRIQTIREQYDLKTARITAPHVTLAGTYWRSGAATPENEADLIEKLEVLSGKIRPFTLHLGGIYTFGERVVYLGVAQSKSLDFVRRSLMKPAGKDKHRQFKPHLTLAMRLQQPTFDEMVTDLRRTEWHTEQFVARISELHLMQRGADDAAWRAIYTMPLRG